MSIKSKGKAVAKASSSHPAKVKGSSRSVKELGQPEPKLSTMFFEIKNELLEQQQANEAEVPNIECQSLRVDEVITEEVNSTDLLNEDADIFKRFDIPKMPSYEQEIMTGRSVDSDKENLQKIIKQYKQ